MKKLIMAAIAAVCAAGSFGSDCSVCGIQPKSTAWAYEWKFTGKTTGGEPIKSTACACKASPAVACEAVRVPTSLKIQGYTWYCSPNCGSDDFKGALTEINEVFFMKKAYRSSMLGGVQFEVTNIIGKNKDKCEVAGSTMLTNEAGVRYRLTFAGLGKYDKKNGRVKNIKGNFAGYVDDPVVFANPKDLCSAVGTCVWECGLTSLMKSNPSVAFGKFSIKYKKSLAKRYYNSGVKAGYPNWVVPMNERAADAEIEDAEEDDVEE